MGKSLWKGDIDLGNCQGTPMQLNGFYVRFLIPALLVSWLTSCGESTTASLTAEMPEPSQTALAIPTPSVTPTVLSERTPTPPEDLEAELWCDLPVIYAEISPEEYEWGTLILENIEPGTTTLQEVRTLLGEPIDTEADWFYNPFPRPDGTYVSFLIVYPRYDGTTVDALILGGTMTLGQLIETYGEPSRVIRRRSEGDPPGGRRMNTLLYYEEQRMVVLFQQALCEFPPELVVENLLVDSSRIDVDLELSLDPDDVEIEWPGLADE
jgi:hypothetical protein